MGQSPGVKAIPDGYPQVIPSLAVDGASAAIDFYQAVFGATVRMRIDAPVTASAMPSCRSATRW